jgi:hypothetical protein
MRNERGNMKSRSLLVLVFGTVTLVGAAFALYSSRETIPTDWEQTSYVERRDYLVNYLG